MLVKTVICFLMFSGVYTWLGARTHGDSSWSHPNTVSSPDQTREKTFQWRGTIPSSQVIEVKGIYGDIHAESTPGSEVEVIATKSASRSNPAEVEIRTLQHKQGVTICAVYPSSVPAKPNTCEAGDGASHVHNNDVRVDFIVRVPSHVRLIARTITGDIDASSLSSDVEAYTALGNIRISTTEYARAKSISGSITAAIGNVNWSGQLDFESSTGEITVKLPASANTELHAESIVGNISTEFPLTVQGSIGSYSVNGTIGTGGRKLNLKTVSGPIKVLRVT